MLADAFVVLDAIDGDPQVITDAREVTVRTDCTRSLRGLSEDTAEYERARLVAVDLLRGRCNQPGGYWIAKDDPQAAREAVTGSVPLEQLRGAALLSNGASRIVDPYRITSWDEAIEQLRMSGPDVLLRRIRDAEADSESRGPLHGFRSADDATAVYCDSLC